MRLASANQCLSTPADFPELAGASISQPHRPDSAQGVPRNPDARRRVRVVQAALVPAAAVLLLYAAEYWRFAWSLLRFPFDLDQGEGFDAWSGWLINLGVLPYTSSSTYPYYSHGYPPVWSYLTSIPMAWSGPGLEPARLVSILATAGASVLIGRAAWLRSGVLWSAPLGVGLFLASPYVFHTSALARVNSATLLFALGAVTLAERPTRPRVILSGAALLAALFTKPTAVDAVAAVVMATLLAQPRRGLSLAIGLGLASAVCVTVLEIASGRVYLLNVLASNSSEFSASQLAGYASNFLQLHLGALALAVAEVVRAARRREWSPWVLYFPASLVVVMATIGKTGAGESYFLPLIACTSVLAGASFTRVAATLCGLGRNAWPSFTIGAALLIQLLVMAHGQVAVGPLLQDRGLQGESLGALPGPLDRQKLADIVAEIARLPGPVLAEDASFTVVAGKQLVGATPPSLRNLYHAGAWDPSPLVRDIDNHRFSLILLDAQMYPEPVLAAIGRSYYESRVVSVGSATLHIFLPGAT